MIIGLCGYAGSGKDEIAKTLISDYGYRRVAFADKIKDILYDIDPVIMVDAYGKRITVKDLVNDEGWDDAKKNKDIRELLQRLGVAVRTYLQSTTWVDAALRGVLPTDKVVVTDVRFINEATQIRNLGGFIWRVKRSGIKAVNTHISETELDGYKVDQIFSNNGSLNDLKNLVHLRMKGDSNV